MIERTARLFVALAVVALASMIATHDGATAQTGGSHPPGSIYIPPVEASDGDPLTIEPSRPGLVIEQPAAGTPWATILAVVVVIVRELSITYERSQRMRLADIAADRAVRAALAQARRTNGDGDADRGAILPPS